MKTGILVVLTLLLSSCGFHLRGSSQMAAANTPVYLDTGTLSSALARQAKLSLLQRQWPLTDDPEQAKTRIELIAEHSERHPLSQHANGQIAEYQLSYQLRYRVLSPGQTGLERIIRRQRNYLDNREQVLGKAQEAEQLLEELREDALSQLLTGLLSIQNGT